jgi:hypothetical protein
MNHRQPATTRVSLGGKHALVSTDTSVDFHDGIVMLHSMDFKQVNTVRNFLSAWLSRNRLREQRAAMRKTT